MNQPQPEILHTGRYLQMVRAGHWEYVQRPTITGIVVIVPITDAGEIILVEQYRLPVQSRVIELPAGLVGDIPGKKQESLETAAQRELLEETGYHAHQFTRLMEGPPSPGLSSEAVTFFLAHHLESVHQGGGDDSEDITVHKVPLRSVDTWLNQQHNTPGLMVDPKTYAGLYFAHNYLNSLK